MKQFFKELINSSIYDIIKFIITLLLGDTVVSFLTHLAIDLSKINFLITYKVYFIIIIILITSLIILYVYFRTIKHVPSYAPVTTNYDVIKKEVSFTYNRDCSKYESDLKIKSNINNLDRIHGKYTWTGSDTATIECKTKHCQLMLLERKDAFIEYDVILKKAYHKKEEVECNLVGSMPDSKHTFVPFFSTRITEVTHELVMNICIPPKYNVHEIICEEIEFDRNGNQKSIEVSLDSQGKYSWKIPNPKLFYTYSIRWDLN